jgi:gluconate 2-dehydrogenase gamma chain
MARLHPHGEATAFEAIAARLWPGSPRDPGALEAGAVFHLYGALAGAYADLVPVYRRGLASADAAARARYGAGLAELPAEELDALLTQMEAGLLPEFGQPSAQEFFDLCLTHAMEGVLSDPVHGGNREFAGWKVIGYPGSHYTYMEADHLNGKPLTRPLQSVADLDPRRPDA